MKHSIWMKTLAILLCAASLMGIIGGAAGALALVNGDLYNKTVDEVIDQRIQNLAVESAHQIASRYADQTLGGCPEEISRYSGSNLLSHNFTAYGYAIVDAEGNVLESLNPELKDSVLSYSIPVTGQYMHLVSTETEAQQLARETAARMESIGRLMEDADGETVPLGGVPVHQVIFTDAQGAPIYEASGGQNASSIFYYHDPNNVHSSSYDHGALNQIGFLYYGADGQLMYRSFLEENEAAFRTVEVYGLMFLSHESGFLFQLDQPESIGTLSNENGYLLFTAFAAPEEAVPAETVPETTAETIPQETTLPPETTEVTEEPTEEQTEATEEDAEEVYSDDSEESYEEYDEEEESYEEYDEESSASADPEEEEYESEEEEYTSEEEESSEEENPVQETEAASESMDIDWDYLEQKAQERIVYEWLLARNLLTEADRPEDLIPDKYLQYWLIEDEHIDPNQRFPAEETLPEETVSEVTEPALINGKPLENFQVNRTEYMDHITGEHTTAKYVYLPLPELTVEVYADRSTLDNAAVYDVLRTVRQFRGALLPVIAVCLLLFILTAVYLYTAAGRDAYSPEIRAAGLNRLPLDLYLCLGIFGGLGLMALAGIGTPVLLGSDFLLGCSLAVACVFVCCLIFIGFCFACTAQLKTAGGFWWRNLLTVRFIFLFMTFAEKFSHWLSEKGFPCLGRFVKNTWHWIWKILVRLYEAVEAVTARTGEKLNRFFSLIPMTWQWLLGGLTIILFALLVNTHNILLILIGIVVPMSIVLYATHCFGLLSESAKRMGKGNLDTKVEDKLMVGCFQNFAQDLNNLADVASVAAQKQLKSERMKTELITNVSHDIKTPLTSIINYVDLLQKPHTEEEGTQYLEVLDRQSQRLKKLVEDLMDMSKASTGNMTVEITRVDAVESVNQALGEFADKLERARLYPVFRHSESSVPIMADGKLVWRVLSNLLSNAVKYAMPGTRIYLDLTHVNGKVILSLKNISREELNVNAEELMERFVRGDVSRNTDGSGLGLNIAKSLMELQKGQLQLLVDGDLFKVTLVFPDAE